MSLLADSAALNAVTATSATSATTTPPSAQAIAQAVNAVGQALAAHAAGRLDVAKSLYKQVLQWVPEHAQAHHNLGIIAMQAQQISEAVACFDAAVRAAPAETPFRLSYVKALIVSEQPRMALAVIDAAQAADPASQDLLVRLRQRAQDTLSSPAHQLKEAGAQLAAREFKAAQEALERFTHQYPKDPAGWTLLAAAFKAQSELKQAVVPAQTAVALTPRDATAHGNLGSVYFELKQYDEAEKAYLQAHKLNPRSYLWNCFLGDVYKEKLNFDLADKYCREALKIKPDGVEALCVLGGICRLQKKFNQSIDWYRKSLEIDPNYFTSKKNIAILYIEKKRFNDASFYLKSIAEGEKTAEIYFALASFQMYFDNYETAKDNAEKGLLLDPENAAGHCAMASAVARLGRYDDFLYHIRKSLDIEPENAQTSEVLLFCLAYKGLVSSEEYLQEAKDYEKRVFSDEIRQAARNHVFSPVTLANRKLRIAYLSGDLREHSVAYFLKAILKGWNRDSTDVVLYSSNADEDKFTGELKTLCTEYTHIEEMTDDEACARIRADKIDVLVDLSGFTGYSRMGIIARRSAPVQAHYLGFFGTTGLTEMDYWIGDKVLIPPEARWHFSETVWALPRVWISYDGREDSPATVRRVETEPVVRFATFNNFAKLTSDTLRVWAQIMVAVPHSKLLIKTKTLDSAINRAFVETEMGKWGVAPERLELRGTTPSWVEHMDLYNTVDIALDPVSSIGGGTTTADALWMGVPVITLAGERMSQRMTASMVDSIGHPDWIAYSEAEYIDKVVALSNDVATREALRPGQRDRMRASPLCDGPGLSKALSEAYAAMFNAWHHRQQAVA
jgi:protein O-GlcNAc transferase